MNRELREWLGIAPADFPVYTAFFLLVLMYFVTDFTLDLAFAAVAIFLGVMSCIIGMKKDSSVSDFTNGVKLFAYPTCLLISLILIALNFMFWNS